MGQQLFATEPVYRDALERCAEILGPKLPEPLLSVITGDRPGLDETMYTQPALFSLEYALAELWRARGVTPSAVLGHSVGEYVAACVAGVFSLEDGLGLLAERARLMQALPKGGGMASVFAPEAPVAEALVGVESQVSIAGLNGPKSTVISGDKAALAKVMEKLAAGGLRAKELVVSHAFHSPLMEPMLDAFERSAERVRFDRPRLTLISNVSGAAAGEEIATARYWRQHVRAPVRFADGVALLAKDFRVFVELGPSPTLITLGKSCVEAKDIVWLSSLRKGRADAEQLAETVAALG
jgi:acyl transferase domain-containing protein